MAALFLQHAAAAAALIGFSLQRRAAPRRGRNPSLTRLRASSAEPGSTNWKAAERGGRRSSDDQIAREILPINIDRDEEEEEEEKREQELAEELESMVEEVLMTGAAGDEGREPLDYDRRARLFDKSSRVFQALKDRSHGDNSS